MNKVMIFILIGALLAGCSTASSSSITHIYAFGDTFSDNGNAHKIFEGIAAETENTDDDLAMQWFDTYYWQGRYSNGLVAVEVLADKLNVDLTDYAVTYAGDDSSNSVEADYPAFKNTGLLGQVQKHITSYNGKKADPYALYYIKIGSRVITTLSEGDPKPIADPVIANISTAISQLAAGGAKRFMVSNMHDISAYPRTDIDIAGAKAYQSYFNTALPTAMEKLAQELGVDITIFDYQAVEARILNNPADYGITNLKEQCMVFNAIPDPNTTVCASPDEYFYWDAGRPTRRVHQIIGEAMAEQLSK